MIYIAGCLGSAFIAIAGFVFTRGIKEGRLQQRVDTCEERLNLSNGERKDMTKVETYLESEISGMKSRLEQRDSLWRRNNEDHIEIFSRINALEKGQAALPGQVAEMMEQRFNQWFERWRKMIQTDIYDAIHKEEKKK